MEQRTWITALMMVLALGCEPANDRAPAAATEGARGQVEREHPGLEQTEQPIPPPGQDRDDDWGALPGAPATP